MARTSAAPSFDARHASLNQWTVTPHSGGQRRDGVQRFLPLHFRKLQGIENMRVGTRLPRRRRIRRRASTNFLRRLDWNNSILLKGELAEEVAKLKVQDGGEIQVHGSGELLQTLLKHDLVDTLRLWQFPVVLGTGKRLFGAGTIPCSFRLVDSQQTVTGAVLQVYERAGNLDYGEMEVGQETVIFDADAAQR